MSNPEVAQLGRNYFNSPENRYTLTLSNPRLTDYLGATLTYRWTDKMWYEQGITAGDVWLPSWTSLDAQVSYKLPTLKSTVKLGGTNLLNQYYAQGYGLARIGGMYYVSITFDELMR